MDGMGQHTKEKMTIEITKDRMFAIAFFEMPDGASIPLTLGEIKQQIKQKGIQQGIQEDVLVQIETSRMPNFKYIIAQGKKPVDGTDATITYAFDVEGLKDFKPVEKADGTVDFKALNLIHNVEEGQLLLTKTPATGGEDGHNVLGMPVKAKKGKEIRIPRGKNTHLSEDGLSLVASKRGQLLQDMNGISVSEVFIVDGDVDSSVGNIDFVGSVIINGTVHTGFSIKASGNVEVRGSVEDATIISEADIILRYGIQGGDRGKLCARGNVVAKFIQNSRVEAGKDVISEVILHSHISAGNAVRVENGKGSIVGGETIATNFITAKTIGSPMSTVTAIRMGVSPVVYANHKKIEEELHSKKDELNKITQSISFLMLKARTVQLTPDRQAILNKLVQTKVVAQQEYEMVLKQYTEIEMTLKESQKGVVKVRDTVHQGVKISIGNALRYINEEAQFCTIQKIGADIEIGAY